MRESNNIKKLIKNLSTPCESTIVGMDIVPPAITIPYKINTKSIKNKKAT